MTRNRKAEGSDPSKKTNIVISHAGLCDLGVVKAELSKAAGRMLTYEETIVAMIRERKK